MYKQIQPYQIAKSIHMNAELRIIQIEQPQPHPAKYESQELSKHITINCQ